jgi:hypothetical protein
MKELIKRALMKGIPVKKNIMKRISGYYIKSPSLLLIN